MSQNKNIKIEIDIEDIDHDDGFEKSTLVVELGQKVKMSLFKRNSIENDYGSQNGGLHCQV